MSQNVPRLGQLELVNLKYLKKLVWLCYEFKEVVKEFDKFFVI